MFRFVQEGYSLDYTSTTGTSAGDVVDYLGNGKLIGVAKMDIAANDPGAVDVGNHAGVYEATKDAVAIAKGDTIYACNGNATNLSTGTGALKFGFALEAAAADAPKVRVLKFSDNRA